METYKDGSAEYAKSQERREAFIDRVKALKAEIRLSDEEFRIAVRDLSAEADIEFTRRHMPK